MADKRERNHFSSIRVPLNIIIIIIIINTFFFDKHQDHSVDVRSNF